MKKLNINFPEDLLKKVDERAQQLYITRTAYIIMAVTQKLQSDDVVDALPEFKKAIEDLSKTLKDKE